MKRISLLILLTGFLHTTSVSGQAINCVTSESSGRELSLKSGSPVERKVLKGQLQEFLINDPRGSLQWQQSGDGLNWMGLPENIGTHLSIEVNNTLFIRCAITEGTCDTIYSDVLKLIPYTVPTVTTSSIPYITSTSAIAGGHVISDGNEPVTERGICWSKIPLPTIADQKTSDGSGNGVFTSMLTGLSSKTTYFLRAYATNLAGTGYGDEITFKTPGGGHPDGIFIDIRDNNRYEWVKIGNQVWMAENLAWLPDVTNPVNGSTTTPLYYVYGYYGMNATEAKSTGNYTVYGALYNWPAALKACPAGWHLPSDTEWTALGTLLGGDSIAGGKMKEAGTGHWNNPNTGASNISNFTGLPAGDRSWWTDFYYQGVTAFFWSATGSGDILAKNRSLGYLRTNLENKPWTKEYGFSVRCVKD